MSNKVKTVLDGRWRSLDSRPLHAAVVALSEHYNAVLADRMTGTFGVGWELRERGTDRNPAWEINGVRDELIGEFSSRSRAIEIEKNRLIAAYVAQHRRQPSRATVIRIRAQAALATKPEKQVRSLDDLSTEWRDRAGRILGADPTQWARTLTTGAPQQVLRADDVPPDQIGQISDRVLDAVSQKRSTWRHWNLWATFGATAAYTSRTDGVDLAGAGTLGLAVSLTFVLIALLTAVLAVVLPTARTRRAAGATALALAVGLRAVADVKDVPALQWVTPMSLRALALPFGEDRVLWLTPAVLEAMVLAWIFLRLASANELGASLIRLPQRRAARLHVASVGALAWRLDRRRVLWSGLLTAAGAAGFTALGVGTIDDVRSGRIDGGFLGDQLTGQDPVAAYFAYSGTIAAFVVAAVCVTLLTQVAADERTGLAEHLRATSAARSALLCGHVGVAALASLVTLTLSGAVSAVTASRLIGGPHVARDAFWEAAQQWPAVAVVIGLSALIVAAAPRAGWMAWVPLLAGGGLTLLGEQLRIPGRVADLSMFGHTSSGVALSTGLTAQLVLLVLAGTSVACAALLMGRRDLANS